MKKHAMVLMLLACLATVRSMAQDIHFSQFFEAPLYRNPALAGIVDADYRIQTVFRSQWNSIANAYKTTSLNAEYKVPVKGDDFITLAMQFFHDKAGSIDMTTTHMLPAINYHKSLNSERSTYLSLGFMGGLVQRRVDASKMTTNSTYDGMGANEMALQPSYSYLDGSAGLSLNMQVTENPENNIVLGAAYHHFNKPKSSFYNNDAVSVQPKMVFSADAKFAMGEWANITLQNDYVQQGSSREVLTGFLIGYKAGAYSQSPDMVLRAGSFYRWGDAIIPVLQVTYKPFTISASYDVNMSKLSQATYGRGGTELSVTYQGMLDRDNSSLNAVLCPRF